MASSVRTARLALAWAVSTLGARAADAAPAPATDLAADVHPFLGTGKATGGVTGAPGGGDAGNTFPGATLPFGMIAWSPDTEHAFMPSLNQAGSYVYADSAIRGFSLTHLSGPGCPVYGNVPFMPFVGAVTRSPVEDPIAYLAKFEHSGEQAAPGSYSVDLTSPRVRVDLTVTTRTGLGRFTFPETGDANVLVDVGESAAGHTDKGSFDGAVEIVGDRRIVGFTVGGKFCSTHDRFTVYFAAEFDRPFTKLGTWSGESLQPGVRGASGRRVGAFVGFDTRTERSVGVRVGISYVSTEGALANLAAEGRSWKMQEVRAAARAAWNRALGRIRIGGGSPTERAIFYTALYHTLLSPNVFSDVDGRYPGFDRRVHEAKGYTEYANFSGWDIYRCQVQLLALLFPREAADMARSLLDAAETGGAAPRWAAANSETGVMVGDPASAIVAGIYAFGGTGFPAARALTSLVAAADRPATRAQDIENRPGLAPYLVRGYIPLLTPEVWGPAATTLEYATADFSIAALAGALGDSATRARYMKRAQSWQSLFDPAVGLVRPRSENGAFVPDFETDAAKPVGPYSDSGRDHGQLGFVEGNAWQYTWMIPFNQAGLIAALGGRARALARLDGFFEELNAGTQRPHFYMGNEPQFAAPWAYTFAGAPAKSEAIVRRILTTLFVDEPAGLPGNDDLGATSAWYVWAALGLYPAIPGVGGLVMGAPLFPSATVLVGGSHGLEITAPGVSSAAPMTRAVNLNGQPHPSTWLPMRQIAAGGKLAFTMGPDDLPPSGKGPAWGTRSQDAPPSFDEGSAPGLGYVDRPSSFIPLARGASVAVPMALRRLTSSHSAVRWSVVAPRPLEAKPADGALADRGELRLSAPAMAPRGCYPVEIRFSSGGRSLPSATVEVALGDEPILPVLDRKGVSHDVSRADADFDRNGASYSAEALYKAQLAPGSAVSIDGLTFTWPRACSLDNLLVDGQTITLPAAAAAGKLGFLGAAEGAEAGARGPAIVTYSDGSTQGFDLAFSDWTLGAGKSSVASGNRIAVTLPYRNRRRDRDDVKTYVFYAAVPLTPGKVIRSVTLPAARQVGPGRLHLFALAIGG
jgi:predicted alpha-1,2-mannosidase